MIQTTMILHLSGPYYFLQCLPNVGKSGRNATQSWKVDVLLLLNTTRGLDKKSSI